MYRQFVVADLLSTMHEEASNVCLLLQDLFWWWAVRPVSLAEQSDRCLGPGEILRGRLRFSCVSKSLSPSLTNLTTVIVKTTKQKIGPPADTVSKVTSNGITAQEPQQNTVLDFSITLTQKRVRPPVWIILVLDAELASLRALLLCAFVKGLYHSNLPSTLELLGSWEHHWNQVFLETVTVWRARVLGELE